MTLDNNLYICLNKQLAIKTIDNELAIFDCFNRDTHFISHVFLNIFDKLISNSLSKSQIEYDANEQNISIEELNHFLSAAIKSGIIIATQQ
jgi:uncharacterized protein YjhX (UPF0386 family)